MICSCCEVTFLESCTRLLVYFLRFWYVISIMPVKLLFLSAEYIASEDFVQAWKALYFVFTGILASYGKDGSEPAESCTENNNVMILSWLLSSWSAWSIKRLMTFP